MACVALNEWADTDWGRKVSEWSEWCDLCVLGEGEGERVLEKGGKGRGNYRGDCLRGVKGGKKELGGC